MAEAIDISSPEFMKLLTDALLNGPGSPEWHHAVEMLGKGGGEADEYRLIIEAREHLESGKGYREVRAGPGFTRKVMEAAARPAGDDGRPRKLTLANIIAALAAVVIVGVAAWVLHWAWPRPADVDERVAKLAAVQWVQASAESVFAGPLEPSWRQIGSLPLTTAKGLKPGAGPGLADGEYRGAGIVTATAMPAEEPMAMQVTLMVPRPGNDEVIAQIFVAAGDQFTTEKATSDRELVVQIKSGGVSVALPDGRVGAQAPKAVDNPREPFMVRIAMNQGVCIVDVAGKRLWAGDAQLDESAPRYLGVRFLRRGKGTGDVIVVQSVQLLKALK